LRDFDDLVVKFGIFGVKVAVLTEQARNKPQYLELQAQLFLMGLLAVLHVSLFSVFTSPDIAFRS
jgi:hypothetical protein